MIFFGSTRIVFCIGPFAIKIPKPRNWKIFLRGLLANMDEIMWYRNSPADLKLKMCPPIFCLGGWILISKRARCLVLSEWYSINPEEFYPIPVDFKIENFGVYNGRIVLVDYADSRYFCSGCENILKKLQ
jgi:hypothetical protein